MQYKYAKKTPLDELIKYNAKYFRDNDFVASCEALQSKWRHEKRFPMGKYGNYLEDDFAITTKSNFLTEKN
ncbi:MAG: hypothetical protein IPL53_08420 [Ignavibacteria bacterium]|nr:hypothetical protein [Ignavibacteria bacterium]